MNNSPTIIPEWLASLANTILEGLPKFEAYQFFTDLFNAVSVGVDLEPVRNQFLLRVQRRNLAQLEGNDKPYAIQCRAAIQGVINWLADGAESKKSKSAESAAWAAAQSAKSAARLASWWSAAAESAAWAAESAMAGKEFKTQRDDLLELIRALKPAK